MLKQLHSVDLNGNNLDVFALRTSWYQRVNSKPHKMNTAITVNYTKLPEPAKGLKCQRSQAVSVLLSRMPV